MILDGENFKYVAFMLPVVRSVDKFGGRVSNSRQLRKYCELLDLEFGEHVDCEMHWLSRGQILIEFLKFDENVYKFFEQKNELPDESILLFNLEFLVYIAIWMVSKEN